MDRTTLGQNYYSLSGTALLVYEQVFKGCHKVGQRIEDVIPVDMFIPGRPPGPEAIMYGVLKLLGEVK